MDLDTQMDVQACHISDNGRPQRAIFTSMRDKLSFEYPQSLQSNTETSTIELPTGRGGRGGGWG